MQPLGHAAEIAKPPGLGKQFLGQQFARGDTTLSQWRVDRALNWRLCPQVAG
jgi:hypothetical protein